MCIRDSLSRVRARDLAGARGRAPRARADAPSRATPLEVEVALGPTALALAAGERLRLHVCSAAHPRWMRSVGYGGDGEVASLGDAALESARPRPVAVRLWADDARPTRLILPVMP